MNEWAKKSVQLAKKKDYLDRLYEVYPNDTGVRDIDPNLLVSIEHSFQERDCKSLIQKLLDLEKFPIKDSYVSFLRKDRSSIERNPKTVERICNALFKLGIAEVKEGILEPKEANRARGQQFSNWAQLKFDHVSLDDFMKSKKGIVFLEDSEKKMLDFCNTKLGLGLSKRPDFVAKSKAKYVVGEAKFLSSLGGNQGRGFDDAIKLASGASTGAYQVAVIDGVLWIESGSQEYKKVEHANIYVFSALLLKNFLTKLQ